MEISLWSLLSSIFYHSFYFFFFSAHADAKGIMQLLQQVCFDDVSVPCNVFVYVLVLWQKIVSLELK